MLVQVLLTFLFASACTDKASKNEYLQNITFSTSVNNMIPQGVADEFSADVSMIYCTFDITENVDPDSEVSIIWIYVYEENGVNTEYMVENWTEKVGDHEHMSMYIYQPVRGWPLGDWRADLYIDRKPVTSASFTIKQKL